MRGFKPFILLILFILSGTLQAQPELLWSRNYGGVGDQTCGAVTVTRDGGYAMGCSNRDFMLIVTDVAGEELWSRTYDLGGTDDCRRIIQATDGGFVLGGVIWQGNESGHYGIMKTDPQGELLWSATYGAGDINELYVLAETDDGGYLIAGNSLQADWTSSVIYVVKLNGAGEFVWHRSYPQEGGQFCTGYAQGPWGQFIFIGYNMRQVGDEWDQRNDVFLLKIAQNGVPLDWATYEADTWDLGIDIVNTNDGGYAIGGFCALQDGANILMMKVDSRFQLLWRQDYPMEGYQYVSAICETPEGGYAIAGESQNQNYILRVSCDGDPLWSFHSEEHNWDRFSSIHQTSDNGYILTGVGNIPGAGRDAGLIRLGEDPVNVSESGDPSLSRDFSLLAAYPNPFNAQTNIAYQVLEAGNVTIILYNLQGQQVAELVNANHVPGKYSMTYNAGDLVSGIYVVRMVAGLETRSRKVVLMR